MAMPEKHAAFDTVAALELCEAAEPCADCGFEHTHGEGHGSDLPALISTLRAAVAEIERSYAMGTLENVVRSPRFRGLTKVADHWEATFVGAFNDGGDVAVTVEAPDCEGVITAAALRISALDAAEQKSIVRNALPLSDAEALDIYEDIFDVPRNLYYDEGQRKIADEMRAILAADTDDAAYEVIAWWDVGRKHGPNSANRRLVAEMRAKYRGAK